MIKKKAIQWDHYFLFPNKEWVKCDETHFGYIVKHPEKFGLSRKGEVYQAIAESYLGGSSEVRDPPNKKGYTRSCILD